MSNERGVICDNSSSKEPSDRIDELQKCKYQSD
jgi:hypothetical protein